MLKIHDLSKKQNECKTIGKDYMSKNKYKLEITLRFTNKQVFIYLFGKHR